MTQSKFLGIFLICAIWGGGFTNLNAVELNTICNPNQLCVITQSYDLIENHNPNLSINTLMIQGAGNAITITKFYNHKNAKIIFDTNIQVMDNKSKITNFINEGTIITNKSTEIIRGDVSQFTNSGTMNAGIIGNIDAVTNTGTMGGINTSNFTINNMGVINLYGVVAKDKGNLMAHIASDKLTIQNYSIRINENQATFNSFSGYKATSDNPTKDEFIGKTAHLVVSHTHGTGNGNKVNITFGAGAKIFIDIDKGFQLGTMYSISKILTDEKGSGLIDASYFKYLTLKDPDIYEITQSGDSFIVNLIGGGGGGSGGNGGSNNIVLHTPITELYKSNIRTMNNFITMSNSMIYPHKYHKSQNLGRKNSSLRADSQNLRGNPPIKESLDSANHLKSYESFAYQNESQNLQTRRIKRQNKRNYSRNVKDSSLRDSAKQNRGNPSQNLNKSAESKPYYFILTPFINHNYFFESGRYNLRGFDYGFLTAFSARVAESNSLGAHFMMSYGTLGDSSDKNFHISNLNLNLGLNYKLDLIWDMYVKARGDFFYFLNQVKTLTMMETIKPNNLGFGASIAYGKDFDFKQGGILGIEGGLDYKALSASEITLDSISETYKKSLYHLLYFDLGISYAKYFGSFGFNANLGIKGNVTANKLAKSQIRLNNFNRSVDMVLDNDKVLGYANVALSYVLNHKNFDMEFSLAYYGNFGDRVISNGGGFEWRVVF